MSVWTFSWWLPNKPPMTRNDRDSAWHSVSWPHGARWPPHGPGAAPIPRGALLHVSALPCGHEAPAGWLGISAPGQQGARHERGGARPLRRPGPGRATSPVSHWSEPVPRPVQTQRCGLFVHRWEACPRPCLQADREHRALGSQGAFLHPLSLPKLLQEAGWGTSQSHCAFIWVSLVLSCGEDQFGA